MNQSVLELSYVDLMKNFDENTLPSLSEAVLGALELYMNEGIPMVAIRHFEKPVIVGSGNAISTAEILYGDTDAVFANENNFKEAIKRQGVDGAIIFSASGEKHGSLIAKYYSDEQVPTFLLTCNNNCSAMQILGEENTIVTPKNREPYTYNTSTYLGWILAKTRENPQEILEFITKYVDPIIDERIGEYDAYLVVLPDKFSKTNKLINIKFKELFGRHVARETETYGSINHAVTLVPHEAELCIQFGEGDKIIYPKNQVLRIPLPENVDHGAMMAIGYYVVGKIQEYKPDYFKKNVKKHIEEMNASSFGKKLNTIIE